MNEPPLEIERLREEVKNLTAALDMGWNSAVGGARSDALEAAAKVAEKMLTVKGSALIAVAIRALKEKQP